MTDFKKQLAQALENITSSGTFFSTGVNKFCFPKMSIKTLDEIAFPLNKIQIQALISVAHKAPFGKGAETILDTNVRNCWEIDASQIEFEGSDWAKFISKTIAKIKPDLGIEGKNIDAHLYKMLVYEEGDFFLPHKDSEKEKGMFGTLIIGLPSKHSGGELVLSFDGQVESISFAENCSNNMFPYIAFYADCQHEIKPTTAGYRVCLVYNLIDLQEEKSIKRESLQPQITAVETLLQNQNQAQEKPFIYLLGHQYTPTNFSLEQLKLKDRPVAEVLLKAAEKAGYYAKMALVTSYQSGELELEYDSGRSRRGYYHNYNEDIDVESASMGEVYEEYLSIDCWDDSPIPLITIKEVGLEDLIHDFELNEGDPIEKEAEGYTGNAGMEMMFWYHYGAVVFWKKENHLAILNSASILVKLKWLSYYTSNWEVISAFEQEMAKTLFFEELNVDYKPRKDEEKQLFDGVVDFLILLNKPEYINEAIKPVLVNYFSLITIEKWIVLLTHFDTVRFDNILLDDGIMKDSLNLNYLLSLIIQLDKNIFSPTIDSVIAQLPQALASFDFLENKNNNSKALLQNLMQLATYKAVNSTWITAITQSITQKLDRGFVNYTLIELITANNFKTNPLGSVVLAIAVKHLENRVSNQPQPPQNWTRAVPQDNSYHKNVWELLHDFLQSPTDQVFDYKSLQANRTAVENALLNVTIDLDKETIRKGSPHTLRLTKNQNAYKLALKKWKEDCVLLQKLN